MKSVVQISGVGIDAFDLHGQKTTYFGFIEEIWELNYGPSMKIPLFKCQWVQHPRGDSGQLRTHTGRLKESRI
jgi:hypothetical protein